jgi:hypothetical protein
MQPSIPVGANNRIVLAQMDIGRQYRSFVYRFVPYLPENPDLAKAIAKIMAEKNSRTQNNQLSTGDGVQMIAQVLGGKVFNNVAGDLTIHE